MDVDPDGTALDAGAVDDEDDVYQDIPAAGSRKRQRAGADSDDDEDSDDEEREARTPPNLHPDDPGNFCKLSSAVKLLLSHPITDQQIDTSEQLLRSYCLELITLYGPGVIKPNHHYATHTPENVRDYGPLQEFWTFLFERINKVLKSFNSSNHSGGELETSFFREFHRTVQNSRILAQAADSPAGSPLQLSTEAMYNATADDRGTIQALARQLDKVAEDGGIDFQLSPQSSFAPLPAAVFDNVLDHLSVRFPLLTLRSAIAPAVGENSYPLYNRMQLFDHVIISQRRYYASTHRKNPYDSFVNVRVATGLQGQDSWAGELLEIFVVNQPKIGIHRYGLVRWFVPTDLDLAQTVWALYPHMKVSVWKADTHLTSADPGPGPLIQLDDILSHVVRSTAEALETKCWLTVALKS
ncbi:hypothetical protein C8R47DRAFT_1107562 [Mycena vitilis]|nr:hypothetical protein C8R47DRAFT_1107562 [Mycena vitilis]